MAVHGSFPVVFVKLSKNCVVVVNWQLVYSKHKAGGEGEAAKRARKVEAEWLDFDAVYFMHAFKYSCSRRNYTRFKARLQRVLRSKYKVQS